MQVYLPPLILLLLAFFIASYLAPRATPFVVGVGSLVAIAFVVRSHIQMFGDEYRNLTWASLAGPILPYIMIGLVIILGLGYLLYLFGLGGKPKQVGPAFNMPAPSPPPETATNFITEGIGNGLQAMNRLSAGTVKGPLLSPNPSLVREIGTKGVRNIGEARLAEGIGV
jgi:hypothetical protein